MKKQEQERTQKFRDAILWAESEDTGSSKDFIQSCKSFLEKRGYLTEKQIEALYATGQYHDEYSDNY